MARKHVSIKVYQGDRLISNAQYVDSTSAVVGAITAIEYLRPNQFIKVKAGKLNFWEIKYNADITAMISLITDLQFYAQLHLKR